MGGFIDISGQKYGLLVAMERVGTSSDGQALWKCRCDCGKYHLVKAGNLKRGNVKSCGCMSGLWQSKSVKSHGMTRSRLYSIYCGMKNRCYNKKSNVYERYGGRGITICQEWLEDFMNFYKWAIENGYSDELSIDRIDNNGNYEPNNCRWSDATQQANNRRSNRIIEYNGEKHTSTEWARITGISRMNIENRLDILGWTVEDALTKKVNKNHKIIDGMYKDWDRVYKKLYARKLRGVISEEEFKKQIEEEVVKYAVQ